VISKNTAVQCSTCISHQ